MTKNELIELVKSIQTFEGTEEEMNANLELLEQNIIAPEVSNYTFWEDLSAEEVVEKTGDRQGKYLNPEFYGQPASAGMFYNPNMENGVTPGNAPTPNAASGYETPTSTPEQKVVTTPVVEEVIN